LKGLHPLKYASERNYKTRHIRGLQVTHIRQAFLPTSLPWNVLPHPWSRARTPAPGVIFRVMANRESLEKVPATKVPMNEKAPDVASLDEAFDFEQTLRKLVQRYAFRLSCIF